MKKFIAIILCAVMTVMMIPSFFASAAALPAQQEAVVVAADDGGDSGQVDNSLVDPLNALIQFFQLWGGLFKTIIGSDVAQGFIPALKQVLSVVSISEFFKTIGQIWNDVRS